MRLHNNGRGAHPKVRATTYRAWFFDETKQANAYDLSSTATGGDLGASGFTGATLPTICQTPVGLGRRFNGSTDVLYAAGTAGDVTELQGEWTFSIFLLLRAVPGANAYVAAYMGVSDDSVDTTHNTQLSVAVTVNRNIFMFWEYAAQANEVLTSDGTGDLGNAYKIPLNQWTLVTYRKYNLSGGTCDVDLYVNGHLIETWTGVNNATGGSASRWTFGAVGSAGGAPTNGAAADVSSAHFHGAALSADLILDDARRVQGRGFYQSLYARCVVEGEDGVGVDVSDIDGYDHLSSVTVKDNVDQAINTGSVKLIREQRGRSLAVLNTRTPYNTPNRLADPGSANYDPMLQVQRDIDVAFARVPLGMLPYGRDFMSALNGQIDEVDWGSSEIAIKCRDAGGRIIDTYIEAEADYGDDAGSKTAEATIQDILDANDATARTGAFPATTLHTPYSPSWNMRAWRQTRMGTMAAIQRIGQQTAYDVRFRFDNDPYQRRSRLTFYDPGRDRPDVDLAIDPHEVTSISEAKINSSRVRNVHRVAFPSKEASTATPPTAPTGYTQTYDVSGTDHEGNRTPAYLQLTHAASITKYGRRFMEVREADSSQIDTFAEAQTMAFGMAEDLREPDFTHSLRMVADPRIDSQDIMRLSPNEQLYTGAQKLAISSVEHSFGEHATTSLNLRGKPTIGHKRWLSLDARMGRVPTIVPTESLSGIVVGDTLRFARSLAELYPTIGAGGRFVQVRNHDFEQYSRGDANPPDYWEMDAGTWGTDVYFSSDSLTGGTSVEFTNTTGRLISGFIPVTADVSTPYAIEVAWKDITGGVSAAPRVSVEFFDETRASVGEGVFAPGVTFDDNLVIDVAGTVARSSNVVTVATAATHGWSTGDILSIWIVDAGSNELSCFEERVAITVTGSTGFTYPNTGGDFAAATYSVMAMEYHPRYFTPNQPASAGVWNTDVHEGITPPAAAAYARIKVEAELPYGMFPDIRVDRVSMFRIPRKVRASLSANQTGIGTTWETMIFADAVSLVSGGASRTHLYDFTRLMDNLETHDFRVPHSAWYRVRIVAESQTSTSPGTDDWYIEIRLRDVTGTPATIMQTSSFETAKANSGFKGRMCTLDGRLYLEKGTLLRGEVQKTNVSGTPSVLIPSSGADVNPTLFELEEILQ